MAKWIKTKFSGVRFRQHPNRKHGVKRDRYFTIRYQADGKRKEEALGWASEGWTPEKAALELAKLKTAHTTGEGPTRLNKKREVKRAREKEEERDKVTFKEFFEGSYFPISELSKKPETYRKEKEHFINWINPVIGDMPLREIQALNMEKIKKTMLEAGKAPRTLQYVFATIRQIWNMARRDGFVERESPTKQVRLPKIDNERMRFLTYKEADVLLEHLNARSIQLHDMALISLHCGLRADEIFKLFWADVDFDREMLTLRDRKGESGVAFMTDDVKAIFGRLKRGRPDMLVFTDRKGKKIKKISNVFSRVVKELGLNNSISDRRQRVVFHTWRHTFASWLVESGEDLYTVQKLLGHASLVMTERYSHLRPDTLRRAVKGFQKSINKAKEQKKVIKMAKSKIK